MAFWNKREEPWDYDPAKEREKRERAAREPLENPLDTLRDWNEKRKADAAAREAAQAAEPAERCPWCGRDMERGYITGRDGVIWTPGRMTARAAWLGPPKEVRERRLRLDDEGELCSWKTVWYCRDCERMTLDARGAKAPGSFWAEEAVDPFPKEETAAQDAEEETKNEEEEET